jgi:hypothetical protein
MVTWLITAITLAAGGDGPPTPAPDPQAGRAIVEKMVAAWAEANRSVRTLDCRASVETLFPKGALSQERNDELGPNDPHRVQTPVPPEDVRTTGGTSRWALDFGGPRIRKEYRRKEAYYNLGDLPEIQDSHHIAIFAGGKFREFRPREGNADPSAAHPGVPTTDAMLFEDRSPQFLLDFTDVPVFWVAGSVTGRLLLPNRMKVLEPPAAFTYRGNGDYKSHKCHIVTLPDQNSKTSVVEYWVGAEPGFPIYFCRAKERQTVYWQIDAEYQTKAGAPALSAWTFTQFKRPTQRIYLASTYRITELQINPDLSADLFDHNPKAGSVVFSVPDNSYKQVRSDLSLAPYVPPSASRWKWPVIIGAVLVIGLITFYAWYRRRRLMSLSAGRATSPSPRSERNSDE